MAIRRMAFPCILNQKQARVGGVEERTATRVDTHKVERDDKGRNGQLVLELLETPRTESPERPSRAMRKRQGMQSESSESARSASASGLRRTSASHDSLSTPPAAA